MSQFRGSDANGGLDHSLGGLAAGYTQAQVDEMKQFNESLTAAGNKSRPNRGGNRSGTRGKVSAPSSRARVTTSSYGSSGSGIGYGMTGNYVVGPSTPSPITKHPSPPRGRSPVRKLSPVRNAFPFKAPEKENAPEIRKPDNSGRTIIVSNKSDGPSKPWIPAHLHQTSAHQTIEEIARMCGQSFEDITDDGVAIPGSRPKATPSPIQASAMLRTPPVPSTAFDATQIVQTQFAQSNGHIQFAQPTSQTQRAQSNGQTQFAQPNVDPNDWFAAYLNKTKMTVESLAAALPSDMDVDTRSPPLSNAALIDSHGGQMSTATLLTPTTFQSSSMITESSEAPKKVPGLKDSRWAMAGDGYVNTSTAPSSVGWGAPPSQTNPVPSISIPVIQPASPFYSSVPTNHATQPPNAATLNSGWLFPTQTVSSTNGWVSEAPSGPGLGGWGAATPASAPVQPATVSTSGWGANTVQSAAPSGWNANSLPTNAALSFTPTSYNTMPAANPTQTYNPSPTYNATPFQDSSTPFNAAANSAAPPKLLKDSRWAC